jgi:hypothetical protein
MDRLKDRIIVHRNGADLLLEIDSLPTGIGQVDLNDVFGVRRIAQVRGRRLKCGLTAFVADRRFGSTAVILARGAKYQLCLSVSGVTPQMGVDWLAQFLDALVVR